jgi:hypothetical protein
MAKGINIMDVVILGGAYYIAKQQGWLAKIGLGGGGKAPPPESGGACSAGDYAQIRDRRYVEHKGDSWNVIFGGAVLGSYETQSAAEQAYNAAVERKCGGGA